ncbi:MAG: MnhB domain-containing protein [Eubacteriaceae bacterium]|nr:MnhB domain-containing protein [Eubacteriaceae bacterium]
MRKKIMIIGLVGIISMCVMAWYAIDLLPAIGDSQSAPNTHISAVFIEEGPEATNAPNMVTGVLADYRGFDTLWETTVMFLAGMAVSLILSNKMRRHWHPGDFNELGEFAGIVGKVVMPIVVPLVLLYAIYVLMHGEVSLGGGFQAGALIAIAFILYATVAGMEFSRIKFTQHFTACMGAVGVFIYAMTGVIPMFFGGKFLQYEKLPFHPEHVAELHSIGILMIEIGVTVTVAATILIILAAVLERKGLNDSIK